MNKSFAVCGIILGLGAGMASAQVTTAVPPGPDQAGTVPLYKVSVVGRTTTAVNFHVLGGTTKLAMRGTTLLPSAEGEAKVKVERGATAIDFNVDKMPAAQNFGPEYLTYVLWAITPDGRAINLGEVQLDGLKANMKVTTTLQDFGLIVTAEPYFGVTRPSDVVVMQAYVTPGTVGAQQEVQAKYELLQRGQYRLHVNPDQVTTIQQDPKVPLDLYEAENAVRIARWAGAPQYAPDIFAKAKAELQQAQGYEARAAGKKPVATVARQAVQTAEDARLLTLKNRQHEQMADAKAAAEQAKQAAAAAQSQAAAAEEARQQAEAEQQTAAANMAAANVARAAADAARSEAEQQAAAARAQAHEERVKLMAELNSVLHTRDSATGLIVDMPDVLFDLNKATLHTGAQVKLAKVAGILLSVPDLKVQVDGYTDSTGTPDYNQQLSEQRAAAVRDFLASQGVSPDAITARGFGEQDPVASNTTASGRQQNRRVELVVNGAAIGSTAPQP